MLSTVTWECLRHSSNHYPGINSELPLATSTGVNVTVSGFSLPSM